MSTLSNHLPGQRLKDRLQDLQARVDSHELQTRLQSSAVPPSSPTRLAAHESTEQATRVGMPSPERSSQTTETYSTAAAKRYAMTSNEQENKPFLGAAYLERYHNYGSPNGKFTSGPSLEAPAYSTELPPRCQTGVVTPSSMDANTSMAMPQHFGLPRSNSFQPQQSQSGGHNLEYEPVYMKHLPYIEADHGQQRKLSYITRQSGVPLRYIKHI